MSNTIPYVLAPSVALTCFIVLFDLVLFDCNLSNTKGKSLHAKARFKEASGKPVTKM